MYCRYRNGLRDIYLRRMQEGFVKRAPIVVWLAGSTGCGKSWAACNLPGLSTYRADGLPWFDSYMQEEVVVLDDLRKGRISFARLLVLLDIYCV